MADDRGAALGSPRHHGRHRPARKPRGPGGEEAARPREVGVREEAPSVKRPPERAEGEWSVESRLAQEVLAGGVRAAPTLNVCSGERRGAGIPRKLSQAPGDPGRQVKKAQTSPDVVVRVLVCADRRERGGPGLAPPTSGTADRSGLTGAF
ncbi:hypothetical protein STEG23_000426 [Scotinomys teguina]